MIFEVENDLLTTHTKSLNKKDTKEFLDAYKELKKEDKELILVELNQAMGLYQPEEQQDISFQSFQKGGLKKYQNGGTREAAIRNIQKELNANGSKLKVDGILGKNTMSALAKYSEKEFGVANPFTGISNILPYESQYRDQLYDIGLGVLEGKKATKTKTKAVTDKFGNKTKKKVKVPASKVNDRVARSAAGDVAASRADGELLRNQLTPNSPSGGVQVPYQDNVQRSLDPYVTPFLRPVRNNTNSFTGNVPATAVNNRSNIDQASIIDIRSNAGRSDTYNPEAAQRQSYSPPFGGGQHHSLLNTQAERDDYFNSQLGAFAEGVGALPLGDLAVPFINRARRNRYDDLFDNTATNNFDLGEPNLNNYTPNPTTRYDGFAPNNRSNVTNFYTPRNIKTSDLKPYQISELKRDFKNAKKRNPQAWANKSVWDYAEEVGKSQQKEKWFEHGIPHPDLNFPVPGSRNIQQRGNNFGQVFPGDLFNPQGQMLRGADNFGGLYQNGGTHMRSYTPYEIDRMEEIVNVYKNR